jgi:hypothetical protein
MSAKFFVLYGDKTITPHITTVAELMAWASRNESGFNAESYPTLAERIAAADKLLQERYKVWALFEYTPEGMAEFVGVAAQKEEMTGLYALELAQEYVEEAQKNLALAITEAQQKAMDRVQFPIAGDKPGFQKYQERIADIREMSIKSLTEYVENGDEIPE